MNDPRSNVQPKPQVCTRNGTLENPRKFFSQDFVTLRESHLKKNLLFTDEAFPANVNIIGSRLSVEFNTQGIEWKRPLDLCRNPQFIVDDISLFDIEQTQLGDCWVLSAMGALTLNPNLMKDIIPSSQKFTTNYAGIFHFRLWHLGEWVDIVIDDLLPFLNGQYFSVRPSCQNEFWPCLLEKAYAKLLGSYQNLHWGNPADAFANFTGGVTMTFDLQSDSVPQNDLWHMVSTATRDTLMACINDTRDIAPRNRSSSVPTLNEKADDRKSSLPTNKLAENVYLNNGLVDRHAYCITDIVQVQFRKGIVKLIRIWNPWGHGEWAGSWNDKSPWWKELKEEDRKTLQKIKDDGEFWMSWEDFLCEFSRLILCNRLPVFLDLGNQSKKWYKSKYWNKWTKEDRSWNVFDKDSFCKNPQYIITVTECDEVKRGWNLVVSLMQSNKNRDSVEGTWLPIGYLLFKVDSKAVINLSHYTKMFIIATVNYQNIGYQCFTIIDRSPLIIIIINIHSQVLDSHEKLPGSYFTPDRLSKIKPCKSRDITSSFKLPPGRYIIIPYTTAREREASFLLQIFLKSNSCSAELGVLQPTKVRVTGLIMHRQRKKNPLVTSRDRSRMIQPLANIQQAYDSHYWSVLLNLTCWFQPENNSRDIRSCRRYEAQPYEHIFKQYATKGSKMKAWDLKRYLNDVFIKESLFSNGVQFNIDGSRVLLASMDHAGRGTLDTENFGVLWRYLTQFKDVFAEIDTKRCGYFSFSELDKALSQTGIQVSSELLNQVIARYGDSEEKLTFVDYLICMVRLKTVSKTFKILSSDGRGVSISREKWMQLML
ncbi:calpain-8-like [Mixophyes fleayi]|uniref:calpain-8-like n=1 Tax=Mixophyes fleayi TaxID=3061075 RepID=UPI003F4DF359